MIQIASRTIYFDSKYWTEYIIPFHSHSEDPHPQQNNQIPTEDPCQQNNQIPTEDHSQQNNQIPTEDPHQQPEDYQQPEDHSQPEKAVVGSP
jgi:hypothetical protein